MVDDNSLGRRDFLEKSAGATTLGVYGILGVRGGQAGEVQYGAREVPYVAFLENDTNESGEFVRTPVYDKLDQEEWERRQTALDVRDQVGEILGEEFEEEPVYTSFTAMDQSPTGFGVEVDVDGSAQYDLQDIEDELPTELEGSIDAEITANRQGIPVIVTERDFNQLSSYTQRNYDPVPGGQIIQGEEDSGTATAEFFHPDYKEGLITAGHVFASGGETVSQWTGAFADEIGVAKDVKDTSLKDFAFIDMTSDESPTDYITTEDNSSKWKRVDGVVTDQTLNNQVGENFEIHMQGQASGRKSGPLYKTKSDFLGNTKMAVVDELMDIGDSGGPMFREQNGNVYLVGAISSGADGDTKTKGTTAETIEGSTGGVFQ